MQRFLVSLLCLAFFSSSFGQSTQQDGMKKEFYEGFYIACVEKQSQSQLTVNSDFTSDVCSCYAKNTTEQVFSSLDLQIGLKKKDNSAIKAAVGQIVNKEKSAITFQQCVNKIEEKFKKVGTPILDKPTKELSKKRGLIGEAREGAIRSGVIECVDAAKSSSSSNVRAYCACSVGSMADNVSQQDLYEIGINSINGQKKMKEMGELGMKRCAHLLL